MKINKFIYILIAGAVVSTSCKKSFLDQKPPSAVNIGDAIKTESDMGDAVNGMFNASRSSSLFGRHNCIRAIQIANDFGINIC